MARLEVHNAIVTRNTDEDLGLSLRGAIFFDAPTLFEGEYPLPAYPCFPFASAEGAGFFVVPKVGDEVEIEILVDDKSFDTTSVEFPEPRWRCMIYSDEAEIDEEFQINYPFRMGWISNSGHGLIFDDFEGAELVKLKHTFGNFLEWDEAGNWRENCVHDLFRDVAGQRTTSITKNDILRVLKNRSVEISKSETSVVKGNYTKDIRADSIYSVGGKHTFSAPEVVEEIGLLTQNISGSKISNVDGGVKEIIGGSKTQAVVSNKGTTISGDESKLVAGKREDTYGMGHKETIAAGDREVQIVLGNFKVSITAGNIEITSLAGSAEIGNAIGKLSVSPTGEISLSNALGNLSLDVAGNVEFGNALASLKIDPAGIVTVMGIQIVLGAQVGNVLTNVTAPVVDTITGAPHIGVPTLFAG